MIITHNAYQYIYRYQGLPQFVQWIDDTVYAYFSGEQYQTLVDIYWDPESGDQSLHMYVRVKEYNDSVMHRIKEIRKNPGYKKAFDWNFLLTTDFIRLDQKLYKDIENQNQFTSNLIMSENK